MARFVGELKRLNDHEVVLFDLPSVLAFDDAVAFSPPVLGFEKVRGMADYLLDDAPLSEIVMDIGVDGLAPMLLWRCGNALRRNT